MRIQDVAKLNADGTVTLLKKDASRVQALGDMHAIVDGNGEIKISYDTITNTYALHHGTKLAEEWKKTEGQEPEWFPEFPGMGPVKASYIAPQWGDKGFFRDGKIVGIVGAYNVYYHPSLVTPTPGPKWVKWSKGDQSITVYEDRRVMVKGFKTYSDTWAGAKTEHKDKLNLADFSWDGRILSERTREVLGPATNGTLQRSWEHEYTFIKE